MSQEHLPQPTGPGKWHLRQPSGIPSDFRSEIVTVHRDEAGGLHWYRRGMQVSQRCDKTNGTWIKMEELT